MRFTPFHSLASIAFLLCVGGCCLNECKLEFNDQAGFDGSLAERFSEAGLVAEDPYLDACFDDPWIEPLSPRSIASNASGDPEEYHSYREVFAAVPIRSVSLNQCVEAALANAELMRDLGGTVLRNPTGATTLFDPAIVFADPRVGEEAALSAFDANFFASAFFDFNDRVFNNSFFRT